MADYYGSIDSVLIRTGIKPEDLGFSATAEESGESGDLGDDFGDFILSLLEEITDLMDRRMRKSYLTEDAVPKGLDGIANDIAADSLRTMVQSRQTPVVRIDDFVVRTIAARTLSPDIEKRLKLYAAGGGVGSFTLTQDLLTEGPVTVPITGSLDPFQTEELYP